MNQITEKINIENSMSNKLEFSGNLINLKSLFFQDINNDLKEQLNYSSYKNISELFNDISNKKYFNEENITKKFKVKEYAYMELNKYFNIRRLIDLNNQKLIIKNNEIDNWKKDVNNSEILLKKIKLKAYTETQTLKDISFQIKSHLLIIKNLEKKLIDFKKEIQQINNQLVIQLSLIQKILINNYNLDLNELGNIDSFFVLNSILNQNISKSWQTINLPIVNNQDLISNISENILLFDGYKLLSLEETIKLLTTKNLFIQDKFLINNISICVLFKFFKPILESNINFGENFNVFDKIFKENIDKLLSLEDNIEYFKGISEFFGAFEKRDDVWAKIVFDFNEQADNYVKDALFIFLMKNYLFEFNNVMVIMNDLMVKLSDLERK